MANHWYDDAIVYNLDVKTFRDSDGNGVGDFPGLTEKLPYLAKLGVTCLWLAPFFPSPWRDDGYDVADLEAIDPRLGTPAQFEEFIGKADGLGIRVIADLVVNHVSDQHPWFQAARSDPASRYRDFFLWSPDKPADAHAGTMFPGEQTAAWTYDPEAKAYYHHRFYPFQPDLNTANPEVVARLREAVRFWLGKGLAGFRLDAAPFTVEHHGHGGAIVGFQRLAESAVDEPYRFLDAIHEAAAEVRDDAVLLAEANVDMADVLNYFGPDGRRMPMLFNFVLSQYLTAALATERASVLANGLAQIPPAPIHGQWLNYLRNHDELDLARLPDSDREAVLRAFGPDEAMRIYGRGLRRRLAPMLCCDRRRLQMAYSLLFAMPGTVMLRYGDEIGMGEDLSLPGRLAVRTPMQWDGTANGGFSSGEPAQLIRPVIGGGPFGFEKVNVNVEEMDPTSLLQFMRRLIKARLGCPEIGRGTGQAFNSGSEAVVGLQSEWDGRRLISFHNLSDRPVSLPIQPDQFGGDLAGAFGGVEHFQSRTTLELEGYGYRWYRVGGKKSGQVER